MDLLIVLTCGSFFLVTAIIANARQNKDFKEALKKKGDKK